MLLTELSLAHVCRHILPDHRKHLIRCPLGVCLHGCYFECKDLIPPAPYQDALGRTLTNIDGSLNPITQPRSFDPILSPDRKSFVYSKWNELWIWDFRNNKEMKIGVGHSPSWSPDGKFIVYQKTDDDGERFVESDIYLYSIREHTIHRLTNSKNIFESNPSWSNDGEKILFLDKHTNSINLLNTSLLR